LRSAQSSQGLAPWGGEAGGKWSSNFTRHYRLFTCVFLHFGVCRRSIHFARFPHPFA